MKVQFYATFRPIVGGKVVEVPLDGNATVGALLETLTTMFPAMQPRFWSAAGQASPYVKVFIDGREMRHLQELNTPIPADAIIDIFPPVAGGA